MVVASVMVLILGAYLMLYLMLRSATASKVGVLQFSSERTSAAATESQFAGQAAVR